MKVSILVAARNEAHQILRCLEALNAIDYPKELMQILIADDSSTDDTPHIINQFVESHSQFEWYSVPESAIGLKGKTNALEYLGRKATGDIWLYTDADIAVPSTWVKAYIKAFTPNVGVIVGVTRMQPTSIWAQLQSIEWLNTLGMVKLCERFHIPITGMGNNMGITKEAYEAVGGYQTIGFSIVEDYALFKAIVDKKFDFKQAFTPDFLAISTPTLGIGKIRAQRKRWMEGVMQSPLIIKLLLVFSALQIPILLLLLFISPLSSFYFFIASYTVITLGALGSILKLKQYDILPYILLTWWYLNIMNLLMLANYFSPGKVVWKGRTY